MDPQHSTGRTHRPRPVTPGQQAGFPLVRVEPTTDTIHPFRLLVGDHDTTEIPMTAAAMRSLHHALTAVLATTPAEPEDFVTEWARAHGATVIDTTPQPGGPEQATPAHAPVVALTPPKTRPRPMAA
ncbi:hypothetical protein GCM10010112_71960 [Actinoplanes lobatus]|uniref:Uncharacterized protein n=1 Tax=Actinoplanes lobatus TaxID=113568 RepID=A0A7W7MJU3_9ACTN|nr:hypothetical protein [Actinoplanes lobatus]MBB4752823.1 hypothetical protein [Actinoplanes lobatus]GGN88454.1 hypothetical protein GCM10010112_71960 [Actinoplanes lobatus]GIE39433.1 hypothetical protein Alo02nite_23310 [Actinoplanes lobatus]